MDKVMTGYFARSIAGHDKGQLYVIVGENNNKYLLADGRLKTVKRPKMKSIKHIQIIKRNCDVGLKEKIENDDKAVNEAIKRAIKLYKQEDENV